MENYNDVLGFWFAELAPKDRFKKDQQIDTTIKQRFQNTLEGAAEGELYEWRKEAKGRLAEIIVLDQFPRNIYRDHSKAFAYDSLALVLAQEAISKGADLELPPEQRHFMYMPFMHSESKKIQERSLELFKNLGVPEALDFALKHKEIIDQFGRYPHRNKVLGRESTEKELEFLKGPNSSF